MSKAADILAVAGLELLWEIHFNNILETIESCQKLLSLVGRPNVGYALDPGNMAIGEVPSGDYLGRHYSVELMGTGEVDHMDTYLSSNSADTTVS